MAEFPIRSLRVAAVLAGLAGLVSSAPVQAATIYVPPVTITQLFHRNFQGSLQDFVPNPSSGYYTSSGFTATLAQGDHVVVTFQAPPEKIFEINDLSGAGVFFSVFGNFWNVAVGSDPSSKQDAFTTTFLEFSGTQPHVEYTDVRLSDCGAKIQTHEDFTFHGSAHFTAIVFDITISHALCYGSQTFGPVGTNGMLFSGGQAFAGRDLPVLEIVDLTPVAARGSSWGRLKSLYR